MKTRHTILIADDDEDDRFLLKTAFEESDAQPELAFVRNGVEVMGYLEQQAIQPAGGPPNFPALIFLDLNMPRKNGWETLQEIKNNRQYACIPVVILSTSNAEHDIVKAYAAGANCYIVKPMSFESLLKIVKSVNHFWLQTASLP